MLKKYTFLYALEEGLNISIRNMNDLIFIFPIMCALNSFQLLYTSLSDTVAYADLIPVYTNN